jgi:KDO2-lipid IV(A) lauroyltransferase
MKRALSLAWLRLTALLPIWLLHALGRALGLLASMLPLDVTRTTRRNLDLCFPEMPPAERERLCRDAMMHQCCAVTELGPIWFRSPAATRELISAVSGEHLLDQALASKRGVIALLPHLGAWELAGQYLNTGAGFTALYSPGRYLLDDIIRAKRERGASRMVGPNQQGMRMLLRTLKDGNMVLLLPDQNPRDGAGLFADFFGHATYTMQLLSRLAMASQAETLVFVAERRFGSAGFHLHIRDCGDVIRSGPLEASVAAVNTAVEDAVRQMPEQYLWHYKRFKQRPEGEPWPYD